MLFLSDAKITIREPGNIQVEGKLKPYKVRINHFLTDLGLEHTTIKLRFGKYIFSNHITPETRQRILNFLFNQCPIIK